MQNTLTVKERVLASKGTMQQSRKKEGLIPAVIYGEKKDNVLIFVDKKSLSQHYTTISFFSTIYTLDVGAKKETVIPKDIQHHPVTNDVLHVDFLRVSDDTSVDVYVPIRFINEERCVGIKRGGKLNVVLRRLLVTCKPGQIPDHIDVDLLNIRTGQRISVNTITLPEGVSVKNPEKQTIIATVAATRGGSKDDKSEDASSEA